MAVSLTQSPAPGILLIRHAGDAITFSLAAPDAPEGEVFLRTNLRQAAVQRAETVAAVEQGTPPPGLDWEDIPMLPEGPGLWSLTFPLADVGAFEAKAYLLPAGHHIPVWPGMGGNVRVKVEPAWTVAENSIYAVFSRLYRDNSTDVPDHSLKPLDEAGYTVIPPTGTFRSVAARLDHILGDLGFRILLLLPPFPAPTTHARMGRYGSPFAALDFYNVDPALAEFDNRTTPLQQFRELADGIHSRGAHLFIDIPINHTGWASQLLGHHPEWFVRNSDGTFHSPGAWGTVWEDLVKLDYQHRALWQEMADVFLYWCRQGVDGFRCDAGYFIPQPVWRYISAKVRQEFPDTIFLLEGLGGPIPVMLDLLTEGGLNWAYSELFQNESRGSMDWYLPQAIIQSQGNGYQVNFAETHDNARLAAHSPAWAKLRTAVAALCSPAGGWGITCGVEWLATEQIRVHGSTSIAEGAADNQVTAIRSLQQLLKQPAFFAGADLQLVTSSSGPGVVLRRVSKDGSQAVLILMNLDLESSAKVTWPAQVFASGSTAATVCGAAPEDMQWQDNQGHATLAPGSVSIVSAEPLLVAPPDAVVLQQTAALASQVRRWLGTGASRGIAEDAALIIDPAAFCRTLSGLPFAPVTVATWPRDERRQVVWLPGDLLLLTAPAPFRYSVKAGIVSHAEGHSLPGRDFHFTLVAHPGNGAEPASVLVRLPHQRGTIHFCLPPGLTDPVAEASGAQVRKEPDLHLVLTNGTGAMSHLRAAWGTVRTQYDALLAANPHPDFPVDRRMVLCRCRAWLLRRGFSTEVSALWTEGVRLASHNTGIWEFRLPCGDGHWLGLNATVHLAEGQDAVSVTYVRTPGDSAGPVTLILRPDIEDRGFHEKWHLPAERVSALDQAVISHASDFTVPTQVGLLHVRVDGSVFVREPERLVVEHAIDHSRGLGGQSDLFSPGYFSLLLEPAVPAVLTATLTSAGKPPPIASPAPPDASTRRFTLHDATRQFIVKRDDSLTVMAGYPWFLDWGRDTLICLRGIAAAGELDAVRDILITFARYEKEGTLPNMIRGSDDSNRDTSDAPLWFFTSVADLLKREGHDQFLAEMAGLRTIREVLISLANGYINGTPNGIRMDPESGLIFSPSHFTWMDTNFPAGTPRQGYPIEIQALWFDALHLLSGIDTDPRWLSLAAQVQQSILTYFTRPGQAYLSDCLHGTVGQSARQSIADDHLRPNQLLALTLGAITDPTLCTGIINSCQELLIPGAIRTLADRPVAFPLPIERNAHLLNDPRHPFWPQYEGDEDTRRKPAYHNGTAWPWPMPMLAEAMLMIYGPAARARAAGVLASSLPLFQRFSLGSLEEVIDGAYPHAPRGCGSQAWSITEWVRVKKLLEM